MENVKERVTGIVEEAQHYVEAKFEHARLKTVEKSTNTISTVLAWIFVAALVFFCMLLLSALMIVLIAEALDSYVWSILIVFGFYALILSVVTIKLKSLLITPIKNKLLGEYLEIYEAEKRNNDE